MQFFHYCFTLFCFKQNSLTLVTFGTERLMTSAGVIITRFSPEHMFCLYCCYFRNCGEHMSTVDCCSLHAIPMINLPFPSLFVYVKLLGKHTHTNTTKQNKTSTCAFAYTDPSTEAKQNHLFLIFCPSRLCKILWPQKSNDNFH